MASSIALTSEHAYVLYAQLLIWFTNLVLGGAVGHARKKYGVPLPAMYSPDAKNPFNLWQRGHQNMLETIASAHALSLACGVFYPVYSSLWCVSYCAGRVIYFVGYTQGPKGRFVGELFFFPAFFAWAYGIYTAGAAL